MTRDDNDPFEAGQDGSDLGEEEIVSSVPEPRRAELGESLVEQLLRDGVDPELAEVAERMTRR